MTPSESRFTAETQRSQRNTFLLIQSGDDDRIKNILPSGIRSNPVDGYGIEYEACIHRTESLFVWRPLTAKQNDGFFAPSAPLR